MAAILAYKCQCCDEVVEGSPSAGYKRPDQWLQQPDHVKAAGRANDDFCTYEDEDGPHYFIRTCLQIPIIGIEEPFLWGVWVSLSKKNYDRYWDTYEAPELSDEWFGFLCNSLPGYRETQAMHATVRPQAGSQRPLIELHDSDHQLATDFRDGITVAEAQRLAEILRLH